MIIQENQNHYNKYLMKIIKIIMHGHIEYGYVKNLIYLNWKQKILIILLMKMQEIILHGIIDIFYYQKYNLILKMNQNI